MIVLISVACGAGSASRADRHHLVQIERRVADDERRDEHADDQPVLLLERRRADDVAGLQVLRGRAGVRGGDADDARRRRARSANTTSPVQPSATKIVQVRISVAIVMPETGFDEEPMSPTMREETVTKKNPKMTTRTEASDVALRRQSRARRRGRSRAAACPPSTTVIGMSRSVRDPAGAAALRAEVLHAVPERRDDRRDRPRQRDQSRGEHRAGAGVADVGAPQLTRRHLVDAQPARRHGRKRHRHVVAHDA